MRRITGLFLVISFCMSSSVFCYEKAELFNALRQRDFKKVQAILVQHPDWINVRDDEQHARSTLLHCVLGYDMNVAAITETGLAWVPVCQLNVIVGFLLERGVDLSARDNDGWTPMHIAAGSNDTQEMAESIRLIVEKGGKAVLNVRNIKPQARGFTPLNVEVRANKVGLAKALVLLGADLHVQDEKKGTPLHYAAGNGFVRMYKTLCDLGANENAQDIAGKTPRFYLANKLGCLEAELDRCLQQYRE